MAVLFKKGIPVMADYANTSGSDIHGGDVVVVGAQVRICHVDIINAGPIGALAVGYGIYQCPKTAGSSTAIADGVKVYWDATNKVITATAGSNKLFGTTVGASADADTSQMVLHIAN